MMLQWSSYQTSFENNKLACEIISIHKTGQEVVIIYKISWKVERCTGACTCISFSLQNMYCLVYLKTLIFH